MAVSVRDKNSITYTAQGGNKTISIPATAQVGDVMYLQTLSAAAPDALTGWALVASALNGAQHNLYRRVVQAGDAGSLVLVFNGAGVARTTLTVTIMAGMDTVTPEQDVDTFSETVSQTTHTAAVGTITTATKPLLFLGAKDADTNSATRTAPSGYTLVTNAQVGPSFAQVAMVAMSTADVSPGTTGTRTFTFDQPSANVTIFTVVPNPSSGTVGVRPSADVTQPAGSTLVGGATMREVVGDDDPATYVSIPLGSPVDFELRFPTLSGPLKQITVKVQCDPGTTTLNLVGKLVMGTTVLRSYAAFTTVNTSGEAVYTMDVSTADQSAQTDLTNLRFRGTISGG